MVSPLFYDGGIDVVDAPDFDVPNWIGEEGDRPKEPPKTMRERLQGIGGKKTEPTARNVKLPRAKKQIPNVPGQYVDKVEDIYSMVAMLAMPFKPELSMVLLSPAKEADPEGETLIEREPPTVARNCAIAWDEVAQRNESVRRALDSLTTAGVYGALFSAHLPLIAIAMRDTKMGAKFGLSTPEPEDA